MLSTRATLVAKQLTATRPFRPRMMAVRLRRTSASEPECPSTSALVEVADHGEHAFLAQPGEGGLVGRLADQRVGVQLPVAGMDDDAVPGADGDRLGLGHRMGDAEEFQVEIGSFTRPPSGTVVIFASPSRPASPSFRRSTAVTKGAGIDRAAQHAATDGRRRRHGPHAHG